MSAFEVVSTNRYQFTVITRHFTAADVVAEECHRRSLGHSDADWRGVVLEPHPWGCERQARPGRQRAAQGVGR